MPNRSVLYEFIVHLDTGGWGVAVPLDQNLIGPVQNGWDRQQKEPNSMTFGGGLLASSPSARHAPHDFCGYSAQSEDCYVSALSMAEAFAKSLPEPPAQK